MRCFCKVGVLGNITESTTWRKSQKKNIVLYLLPDDRLLVAAISKYMYIEVINPKKHVCQLKKVEILVY